MGEGELQVPAIGAVDLRALSHEEIPAGDECSTHSDGGEAGAEVVRAVAHEINISHTTIRATPPNGNRIGTTSGVPFHVGLPYVHQS